MTSPSILRQVLLRVPPSDRVVLGVLALTVVVAGVRWPAVGPAMAEYFLLHLALFLGFAACSAWMAVRESRRWVYWLRPVLTVAVIFTLYTSLGKLGVLAMPYLADATLSEIDTRLFGVDPSLWIQKYQTPVRVEFLSFFYGAFIPYIHVSLFLNCLGRPPVERDQFLTGWVFTYGISYLGYLFVPGHGPVVYHAADYDVSLTGNVFYRLVQKGIEDSGGMQGVFPSLHVGGSVYLCLYDFYGNRLRALTFLPLVILIYAATIFLRYHYVIDLIAGTVIAVGCIPLGRWAFDHWLRRRRDAGLTGLPGNEGDAVPALSGVGPGDA